MNTVNFHALTTAQIQKMGSKDCVAAYNEAATKLGERTVNRFASLGTAWRRLGEIAERFRIRFPQPKAAPVTPKAKAEPAAPKPERTIKQKAAKAPRPRRGTNIIPTGEPVQACREGSKQAILVDMLSRKEGATMQELIKALKGGKRPWLEATVRSGFGWDLKNKGYGVRSVIEERDGKDVEVFYLVVPTGQKIPAHTPLKG